MRKKYFVIPIMDNETYWGSKYKMVKGVFKSFCEHLAAANSLWEELKNFADLLAKSYAVSLGYRNRTLHLVSL